MYHYNNTKKPFGVKKGCNLFRQLQPFVYLDNSINFSSTIRYCFL
jgi:hypothetical protein